MLEYESVKRWFDVGDFKESTKHTYLQYMAMFCGLLGKTPDELTHLNSEQALEIQQKLHRSMKEELGLRDLSIIGRLTSLHTFWRINGVPLTSDIMGYKGSEELKREVAKSLERAFH